MRFYLIVLSGYSVLATGLILLLSWQNANLKQQQPTTPPPQIDYGHVEAIPLASSPKFGEENAPVTLVMFSDYECPFCAQGSESIAKIMSEYPEKIQLVIKHFPLGYHPNARTAASAALAAEKQGKFWEMHKILHGFQDQLGEATYLDAAESLGLDMERFISDMQPNQWEARIQEDVDLGIKLQVAGTPTIYVNGVFVPPTYESLKEAVDHMLQKQLARK